MRDLTSSALLVTDGLQAYRSGGHRVSEESEDNCYGDLGGGVYMGVMVIHARR